jgi:hypothetical protein
VAADVEDAKEEREKEINSSPGTRIKSMQQQPRSNRGNRGEERRGEERSDFINNESTELILILL